MKESIYTIFLFFGFHTAFGQSLNVAVIPFFEEGKTFCESYESEKYWPELTDGIGSFLEENGYKYFITDVLLRKMKNKNSCQIESFQSLGLSAFFRIKTQYETTSTGNYVRLSIGLWRTDTSERIAYRSVSSNKMYTENVAGLARQAFKKVFQDFEPYLEDPELADQMGLKELMVDLNSDVDENIPLAREINENAVAVIIGNSTYQHPDVPKVDFAIHDARTMKMYLQQAFGFKEENILLVENATQADFYTIFGNNEDHKGKLFNFIKPDVSDVFVYYSGHGAPNPESKKGYFVPVDADPSLVQFNGYSLKTFYTNLGKLPYRSIQVVIDACFSGNSAGGTLLKNISPVVVRAEDKILKDERAVVITSAEADEVSSWYPEKNHSLLTYYYLKAIQGMADADTNGEVSLTEIASYLNEQVPYMARRLNNREQHPQVYGETEKVVFRK